GGPAADRTERYPRWYIRELFRDAIELKEVHQPDKTLVVGQTGELYLFYNEPVNVSDDEVLGLIADIRGTITASIRTKTFPRNTPQHYVLAKRLQRLPQ